MSGRVLVLGAEEFKNTAGDVASVNQNAAAWQGREDIDCTFMWPAAFGLLAQEPDAALDALDLVDALGDGAADATTGPGDDGHLLVESVCHVQSLF